MRKMILVDYDDVGERSFTRVDKSKVFDLPLVKGATQNSDEKLSELDENILKILKNKKFSDYEKIKFYNDLLRRYLVAKNNKEKDIEKQNSLQIDKFTSALASKFAPKSEQQRIDIKKEAENTEAEEDADEEFYTPRKQGFQQDFEDTGSDSTVKVESSQTPVRRRQPLIRSKTKSARLLELFPTQVGKRAAVTPMEKENRKKAKNSLSNLYRKEVRPRISKWEKHPNIPNIPARILKRRQPVEER